MKKEKLIEILESDYDISKREKDNVLLGMQIITRHIKDKSFSAGHDIVYYGEVSEAVDTITENEAIELRNLGWMYDREYDCFSCFV